MKKHKAVTTKSCLIIIKGLLKTHLADIIDYSASQR